MKGTWLPRDKRMSRTLHVLIHMDRRRKRATSATTSEMLGANSVFVRRMMPDCANEELWPQKRVMAAGGRWPVAWTPLRCWMSMSLWVNRLYSISALMPGIPIVFWNKT